MIETPSLEELVAWLEGAQGRGCNRLELRQHGTKEARVREWLLPNGISDATKQAKETLLCAERDSRNFASPVSYLLLAFAIDSTDYFERLFISARGRSPVTRTSELEPPTAEGLLAQLMRHNEAASQMAVGQTTEIVRQYQKMLDAVHERVTHLEERQSKVMSLYESLTSLQHDRELEVMRMRQADKRTDFFREKLDLLAPVVMTKLLPPAQHQQPVLGEEMIRQLLKSLRPEQLQKIAAALEPTQTAILTEIYSGYATREAEREAKAKEKEKDKG